MFPGSKEVKHIACSRCRERKVKCDGQKPGCRRCQRLGHECLYVQGKKQQGKSEWTRHLRTFNSQPGKAGPTSSAQSQNHTTHSPYLTQRTPTIEVSTPDPSIPYSRSPSPYLGYPVSTPSSSSSYSNSNSIVIDAYSSFSNCDTVNSWMTQTPPMPIDGELLDPQLFTFNSAASWCDTNYTSGLITMTGPGVNISREQSCGLGAFGSNLDPSLLCNPPSSSYPSPAATDNADWRPQYMTAYPSSQDLSHMSDF